MSRKINLKPLLAVNHHDITETQELKEDYYLLFTD